MGLLRAFCCFLPLSSYGLLLFAGSALAEANVETASLEATDECLVEDRCVDQYLYSLYERTPKIDTVKVSEKEKVKAKSRGRTRFVVKTITKFVTEDYAWKDLSAAQRLGISLKDYVIGGMQRSFKLTLYHALRALDDAGLVPGITSGFRDDYRQGIASGFKAHNDCSYHGGSRHGGYGHGLAADIVSVRGETRSERFTSSEQLWKWIDTHEKELGIGRPYLDRDPPHVGPIDGKEFAEHRAHGKKRHWAALHNDHGASKHGATATTAGSWKGRNSTQI
jgi:hypothetical protein